LNDAIMEPPMNRILRLISVALLYSGLAAAGPMAPRGYFGALQTAAPVSRPALRPLDPKPFLDYVDTLLARFEKPADGSLEAYTAALKRLTGRWNDDLRQAAQAAGADMFAAYKKAFPEAGSFDTIFVNIQSADPATARKLKAAKEFIAGDSIDGFLSPADIDRRLDGWVRDHPRYASVRTFGRTTLGRPMRVLEITDREVPNDGKAVILFDALTHPVEILTGDAVLGLAERLLAGASAVREIREWLRSCRILIVPVINPDGLALVWSGEIGWRKNARLKDGRIYGVDLNRNFPSLWQACEPPANRDPESIYCGGDAAASEPETRALMELIEESKPVLGLSFHTQGETLVFPYGCKSAVNEARSLFLGVAAELNRELTNDAGKTAAYRIGNSPEIYYEAAGSMIDWAWSAQGSLSYVLEFLNKDSGARARTVDREKLADKLAPAWKGALRRLAGSGVKARLAVRSPEEAARLSYTITPEGAGYPAEFSRKKWTLRTPGGLLYNLLLPGSYRFDFFLGDEKIKSLSANVGPNLVDLGAIDLAGSASPGSVRDQAAVADWLKKHAVPLASVEAGRGFRDLAPLKKYLAGVDVVGMGETTHGTREFFQFKHRLLEFLACEMGFNEFSMEGSLPDAWAVDRYVRQGEGDAITVLQGLEYTVWETREVLESIQWIRGFNRTASPDLRIGFSGFDMKALDPAIDYLEAYAVRVAPEETAFVRAALEPLRLAKFDWSAFSNREEAKRQADRTALLRLQGLLQFHAGRFARLTSPAEHARALEAARVLAQFDFAYGITMADPANPAASGIGQRDLYMAENIEALFLGRTPRPKIAVWGHNGHIALGPFGVSLGAGAVPSMGSHLRRIFGPGYYALGFAFGGGSFRAFNEDRQSPRQGFVEFTIPAPPADSVEAMLAQAGLSAYFIDFRSAPASGPVRDWLNTLQPMMLIGASFKDGNPFGAYSEKIRPADYYDGLIYVQTTSASVPLGKK
jgi:erythromycin esterase-like protein